MALNRSTGLRNKMLDTGSFRSVMTDCFINIYSGTRPASADDAVPGSAVLLATIKDGSDDLSGLDWETSAASGSIKKLASQVWREDAIIATGVAGWFRIFENGDTPGNASATAARADGTVGTSGADMALSSVNFTQGATLTLSDSSKFTLP